MPARIYIYYNGADLSNYRNALEAVGLVPVFSTDPAASDRCDGLLLPGGGDIDPARYGQTPLSKPRLDLPREAAEFALLDRFLQDQKPIFGICLGEQMLNVALGGSLKQLVMHHDPYNDIKDSLHVVHNAPDSLMVQLYGETCIVNTYHRQAIDRLGAGLKVIQWAEDGVTEGVVHETLPVLGVQWHPERIFGAMKRRESVDGLSVFQWFADQMR